ncbi:probable proline iminopeptidase [Clytia hemisphaerica]|uniref:prolyl aminopeptidase n=1 Tax=Clytia hemisphaerica TaxID=252671 RepID=A0A7M5WWZ2_9CNID|eukprot:TCONS_00019189-protein
MSSETKESLFDVGNGIKLWYRTWGNSTGIPVLFVHGGPGNCVADYDGINEKFFNKEQYFVVEIDQRGTGNSLPSVRDGHKNMPMYKDISITQMAADFEKIRQELGISQWLVFGGSWGSTLGLYYAENYPSKCLGLIIRGIFLNTKDEFDAVYSQKPFEADAKRLAEFNTFFELASNEAKNSQEQTLDPNDSERMIRLYEKMILRGDRDAIWRFYVFENNLVEEDESKLLYPLKVSEGEFPTALSVSFFEARLFLRGTFEHPLTLMEDVKKLKEGTTGPVKTWVVQGTGDEVCPDRFARDLVDQLKKESIPTTSHFVDAGHKASSDGVFKALQDCIKDFNEYYTK